MKIFLSEELEKFEKFMTTKEYEEMFGELDDYDLEQFYEVDSHLLHKYKEKMKELRCIEEDLVLSFMRSKNKVAKISIQSEQL